MRRREFLALAAGIALSLAARAQETRRVIGYLSGFSANLISPWIVGGFLQGLRGMGYVENGNLKVEYRWADGQYDRLALLAAELVGHHVAVIACSDVPSAVAAKETTRTIPIVFVVGADPVMLGLIDSLSRPGGNLTGVSILLTMLAPKRLEIMHELLPNATTIAVLANPKNPNVMADAPETEAAANNFGQHLEILAASTEDELGLAFATMAKGTVSALLVMPDPFFMARRRELVALAARHALPAIYPTREFVEVGGLMSYGSDLAEPDRLAGIITGKILGGAKPADLPVEQSTKFELAINLNTAKSLGLVVPESLLARASEVIE